MTLGSLGFLSSSRNYFDGRFNEGTFNFQPRRVIRR